MLLIRRLKTKAFCLMKISTQVYLRYKMASKRNKPITELDSLAELQLVVDS